MKVRIALFVALFLAVSLVGLRAKPPAEKVEDQIRDLEEKINAVYATNDLPLYFSFYTNDFSQWLPEGRTGLAAYQKEWTKFIQGGARVEAATLSDLLIQVGPSGDTAVASYILHVRIGNAKGEVSEEDNQESDVFFKRDGTWKVVFLHYCSQEKVAMNQTTQQSHGAVHSSFRE